MRCPKCKSTHLLNLQNPQDNFYHSKRCWECGLTWTPVRLTPAEFQKMQATVTKANKEQEASGYACLDNYLKSRGIDQL